MSKSTLSRQLRFFADENLPLRLVKIIRIFDEDSLIDGLLEHFAPGTPDEVWLAAIEKKWSTKPVVLGGDGRVLKNPAQLAVLKRSALHFVLFADGFVNLAWHAQVLKMIQLWPKIVKVVAKDQEPTLFEAKIKNTSVEKVRLLREVR